MAILSVFLCTWFAIVLGLSLSGWFQQFSSSALMMAGLIPAVIYICSFYLSQRLRDFVQSLHLRWVTLIQAGRIIGSAAFFVAYAWSKLPGRFALPTAITDLLWGVSAFVVAATLVTPGGRARRGYWSWSLSGLAALLVSAILGTLTGPTRVGFLVTNPTSQAMTLFPLSLVPTFFGPITMICHICGLQIASSQRRNLDAVAGADHRIAA